MSEIRHIERIKKLLALAKSSNVHEAALAMEHAQRLIAEHNLTMQDVRISDVKNHVGPMAKAKTPARYLQALAQMVADAFGCHVFLQAQQVSLVQWETSVCFVGIESAADLAGYAFDVLRRQIRRDRLKHLASLKRCKPATKIRRSDAFCDGWVFQVSKKVRALALSPENEGAIAAWIEKENLDLQPGGTRKTKGPKANDLGSVLDGVAAGTQAYLHAGVGSKERKRLA